MKEDKDSSKAIGKQFIKAYLANDSKMCKEGKQ